MVTLNRTFVVFLFVALVTVCWLTSERSKTAVQQAWASTKPCLSALGRPFASCAQAIRRSYRSWRKITDEHPLYREVNNARGMRNGSVDGLDGLQMAETGHARGLSQ
jgi:hypothetical protein